MKDISWKREKNKIYKTLTEVICATNYNENPAELKSLEDKLATLIVFLIISTEKEIINLYKLNTGLKDPEAVIRLREKIEIEKERYHKFKEISELEAQWNPEDFFKHFKSRGPA